MESAFASASAIADQRQKIEQYKHILASVISSNDIFQAKKFIDHGTFLLHSCFAIHLGFSFCDFFPIMLLFWELIVRKRLAVLSDDVPLVVSRQLLQTFAQELGRLEPETQKEIAHYILAQIQPRVVSFEEQVNFGSFIGLYKNRNFFSL